MTGLRLRGVCPPPPARAGRSTSSWCWAGCCPRGTRATRRACTSTTTTRQRSTTSRQRQHSSRAHFRESQLGAIHTWRCAAGSGYIKLLTLPLTDGANALVLEDAGVSVRSGAFLWAAELGILGKRATEKEVPAAAFTLNDECLEILLGRMWAGDGFIAGTGTNHVPFYATSSKRLARDVQLLLLRLGIQSGLHTKQFRYRDAFKTGYTVHLIGEGAAEAFPAAHRTALHRQGTAASATA